MREELRAIEPCGHERRYTEKSQWPECMRCRAEAAEASLATALAQLAADLAIGNPPPPVYDWVRLQIAKILDGTYEVRGEASARPPSLKKDETAARVARYIAWHRRTPNASLFGNSRVAFDAQSRCLDQLAGYLKGDDDYLNAYVDYEPAPDPLPSHQEKASSPPDLSASIAKWRNRSDRGFDPEELPETTAYWNGVRAVLDELEAVLGAQQE